MGFPAQLDPTDQHFPDDDSVSHFAAKELQIILRVLVVVSMVATAITMATFWFFAWFPLLFVLACILALIATGNIERRTRVDTRESESREHREELAHELHPEAHNAVEAQLMAKDEEHFTPMSILKKESVLGLEILIGVALGAIALAVILLPWELTITGAVLFFLYSLFVMGPVWLGGLGHFEENERAKLRESHA